MALTYQPFAGSSEIESLKGHASHEERPAQRGESSGMQWPSLLGAGVITAYGVIRRTIPGMLLALAGGTILMLGLRRASRLGRSRVDVAHSKGLRMEKSIEVSAPREQVYRAWRKLDNLPAIMTHLREVQVMDERYSRWVVSGPEGTSIEWYTEIINERPNRMIAWKSVQGADYTNAGSVRFSDTAEGGTRIDIKLECRPPVGRAGEAVANLFSESANRQMEEDLALFKLRMEEQHRERSARVSDEVAAEIASETTGVHLA